MRQELAKYQEFVTVSQQIVEVNEAICEARPISAFADTDDQTPTEPVGERGGSSARSKRSSPPK